MQHCIVPSQHLAVHTPSSHRLSSIGPVSVLTQSCSPPPPPPPPSAPRSPVAAGPSTPRSPLAAGPSTLTQRSGIRPLLPTRAVPLSVVQHAAPPSRHCSSAVRHQAAAPTMAENRKGRPRSHPAVPGRRSALGGQVDHIHSRAIFIRVRRNISIEQVAGVDAY